MNFHKLWKCMSKYFRFREHSVITCWQLSWIEILKGDMRLFVLHFSLPLFPIPYTSYTTWLLHKRWFYSLLFLLFLLSFTSESLSCHWASSSLVFLARLQVHQIKQCTFLIKNENVIVDHDNMSDFVHSNIHIQIYYNVALDDGRSEWSQFCSVKDRQRKRFSSLNKILLLLFCFCVCVYVYVCGSTEAAPIIKWAWINEQTEQTDTHSTLLLFRKFERKNQIIFMLMAWI